MADTPNERTLKIALETFTELASTLKRERDEVREHLREIKEYGTEEINAAVELRQKLARALVDLDNMQDQRDLAMKVIKRLEQERGEARGALASREVVIAQQNVITDLILECNTAREALMKIEQIFIDSDDTYEDLIKMGNIARAVLEAAK
jgi:seryl-tRNA synthetase